VHTFGEDIKCLHPGILIPVHIKIVFTQQTSKYVFIVLLLQKNTREQIDL